MKEFLSRFSLILIIVCYVALVFALYAQLNNYLLIMGLGCATWRVAHYYGKMALIRPLLLSAVALTSSLVTVILLYQQGLFNILLHLIFLGFSLKFLELRSVRDIYFFINTGFVLIALFLIFHSSLLATFIASLLLLLLLSLLLSLQPQSLFKKSFIQLLIKSCLLSLPFALLLFIVVPRLPSLWKMPIQKQAITGLSDSVSPGEIAFLSRSSALAFRATFSGQVIASNERYWRVMTLDNFDGKTWSQSKLKKLQEEQAKQGTGRRLYQYKTGAEALIEYQLIVEPHYNHWLPVLDYAITPNGLMSLTDHSLRSDKAIVSRRVFSIQKLATINATLLSTTEKMQLTQLPTVGNNKTERWIDEYLQKGTSKEQILQQLLNRFAENFFYTLRPALLGQDQIDDFLFNTQSGFCVHYASSYLYVARRLGFPARMVTGYLGGQWHVSERFFTVRQYDAHAWVEIWVDNRWLRVDPTAYVAPERVESGLQASLTDSNEFLADEYLSLQKWQSIAWLNELRNRLAQVDYLWAFYVVNFDNQKQQRLIQRWLTQMPWSNITYSILLIMVIIFGLLLIIVFKPWQNKKIAPEDVIYLSLQKQFKNRGIRRVTGQTVSEYCLLLSTQSPLSSTLCESFVVHYNAIKYQTNLSIVEHEMYLKQLIFIAKQLKKFTKEKISHG